MSRVEVRKTHKLYIGGAFPRSESGRTYEVLDAKGRFIANMAKASRKDARDAVRAARSAFPGWSTRTPYNRGQVIYRIAEVMEGRRDQLVVQLREATGITAKVAEKRVDVTIDRVVWYAGWADKYVQVLGNANPVSRPVLQPLHPRAHRGRPSRRPPAGVPVHGRRTSTARCLASVSTVLPAITAPATPWLWWPASSTPSRR